MAPAKEKPDLQKKVHEVPHKPGVYLMRDRFNRVIYVGKARDLRARGVSSRHERRLRYCDEGLGRGRGVRAGRGRNAMAAPQRRGWGRGVEKRADRRVRGGCPSLAFGGRVSREGEPREAGLER